MMQFAYLCWNYVDGWIDEASVETESEAKYYDCYIKITLPPQKGGSGGKCVGIVPAPK
jgi:hypothetical protein